MIGTVNEDYVVVKDDEHITRIPKKNLLLVETWDKSHYIRLITKAEKLTVLGSVKGYEEMLGDDFLKLSASCIVKKDSIYRLNIKK